MKALSAFVTWLEAYRHEDKNGLMPPGVVLQYHPRSNRSSHVLAELLAEDLLDACPTLARYAESGDVAFAIDRRHRWANGKQKALDFSIGIPEEGARPTTGRYRLLPARGTGFSRLLVAIEEKAVATEHGKSQPRVYSELNDSHVIVHAGDRYTIAGGLTWVNIATTFLSPLRQAADKPIAITRHDQPAVASSMITHLRGLPVRDSVNGVGFDAYCTFVLDLDNQGRVALHLGLPSPQRDDPDRYEVFVERIARLFEDRFSDLENLPPAQGLTVEESLRRIAAQQPGTLTALAEAIRVSGLRASDEVSSLIGALDAAIRTDD